MNTMVNRSDLMIDVRGVSKQYGRLTAVNDVSFHVSRGEICGFLGPNGAGKTTTLRMMLGLVRPTSGQIFIQGTDVHAHSANALAHVGAIIEESRFYPYLTGEQNLRQVLRLRGLEISPTVVRERLAEVGLEQAANRRVKGYSLGMRQRLSLALAMLQDPHLLILDEPMNGLDPSAIREFRLHLLKLSQAGVTILLSSHILSEVEQLATRVIFLNKGQVVGIDDRTQSHAVHAYVRATDSLALTTWFKDHNVVPTPVENGAFTFPLSTPGDISELIRQWVLAGIHILEVKPYAADLEAQYLERMSPRAGDSIQPVI